MGDPRLLERSQPVERFGTPELAAASRRHARNDDRRARRGLAAPQIGVGLRVVIFGFEHNERYPDAEPVPYTELVNPVLTPLDPEMEEGWEGCLSVPGLRGRVPRFSAPALQRASIRRAARSSARRSGFHARVVQHECDHLDGILYPMRMRDMRMFGFTDVLFPDAMVDD